jgi:hypothetical protein
MTSEDRSRLLRLWKGGTFSVCVKSMSFAWKGGASAPPLPGRPNCSCVLHPAQLATASSAGSRINKRGGASSAELKLRPSTKVERFHTNSFSPATTAPIESGLQPLKRPDFQGLKACLSPIPEPAGLKPAPFAAAIAVDSQNEAQAYQIWQRIAAGRTIGSPSLQSNACAKAGMLEGAAMARKRSTGCGLVFTSSRSNSGLSFAAHTWA